MMSALMTDLSNGSVSPNVGTAICNAGGKLLKVNELMLKYSAPNGTPPHIDNPPMMLAGGLDEDDEDDEDNE